MSLSLLIKLQKYYSFFNSFYYLFYLSIFLSFFIQTTTSLNSYISNYVGNYYTLDGGTNVNVAAPAFLWADTLSNIIFVDQESCVIREYNATSRIITTLVGTFLCGDNGQGLPGTLTQLYNPGGMRGDTSGNLYFSESVYSTVRKWTRSTGLVSKIAGTIASGSGIDNIPATTSQLHNPQGIFITTGGLIYIADSLNHRIRLVAENGIITSIAGTGSAGTTSDGQLANIAQIDTPYDIIGDSEGNLYIAQGGDSIYNIRKIGTNGIISTLVTSDGTLQLQNPYQLAFHSDYGLYISVNNRNVIYNREPITGTLEVIAGTDPIAGLTVEGIPAALTFLDNPTGICLDTVGNLYIGQVGNKVISKVTHSNGRITTLLGGIKLAGDNGPATAAVLNQPTGLWGNSNTGKLYIADSGNSRIRVVDTTINNHPITSMCDSNFTIYDFNAPYGIWPNPTNTFLYVTDTGRSAVYQIPLTGNDPQTVIAGIAYSGSSVCPSFSNPTGNSLYFPTGIWVNSSGFIFFADTKCHVIYQLNTGTNTLSVLAGTLGVSGFAGEDGLPTAARLNYPYGIWGDSYNNFYISDTVNARIRFIDHSTGLITTIAGGFLYPAFATLLRKATDAILEQPTSIMGDSLGNFFITERNNMMVRKLYPSGSGGYNISVFTGFGSCGQAGKISSGSADTIYIGSPSSLWINSASTMYFTDSMNVVRQAVEYSDPTGQPSRQPTSQPSMQPTSCPTTQPTAQPQRKPSSLPSVVPSNPPSAHLTSQPSRQPSSQPNSRPTFRPSSVPTGLPSCVPSPLPSLFPSGQPTSAPSSQPSVKPTGFPSCHPSLAPSSHPSCEPSTQPSSKPSVQPSSLPSLQPASLPTTRPSTTPSLSPSSNPASRPSVAPSAFPSSEPSVVPSGSPFSQPSALPSCFPTAHPSSQPSKKPSTLPSSVPLSYPSTIPTSVPSSPTDRPSAQPSLKPFSDPSLKPSAQPSLYPSSSPTRFPSTVPSSQPSNSPSNQPSSIPSSIPSDVPSSSPSNTPSSNPSCEPTSVPNAQPSASPSDQPSSFPSCDPSSQPTLYPSGYPSSQPTAFPSSSPSLIPFSQPTFLPTEGPSSVPSGNPSSFPTIPPTLVPSSLPSMFPSTQPSSLPSTFPTVSPSTFPSASPSSSPTGLPSSSPTYLPTSQPTTRPSCVPSSSPTTCPSNIPSSCPSSCPSTDPSSFPTSIPSDAPSLLPSAQPSSSPSSLPTLFPSSTPSSSPSSYPTLVPSGLPASRPSSLPSSMPSSGPSCSPSNSPSSYPTLVPSGLPTSRPSSLPSSMPSSVPSCSPSNSPSSYPTLVPSGLPTSRPSSLPSSMPSSVPSCSPSNSPSSYPTLVPSGLPTSRPSSLPSSMPSSGPSCSPSNSPSSYPTLVPSGLPTSRPSSLPSSMPSSGPSCSPSNSPSSYPTLVPSGLPTSRPSSLPSSMPSSVPSSIPSTYPSTVPSSFPTFRPISFPSSLPTGEPTCHPSSSPSSMPSISPSSRPSAFPSPLPSSQPSRFPSSKPTASILLYPGPLLSSVTFVDDGSYVVIEFDSPTNLGGFSLLTAFSCNILLEFSCSSLSKCQWINAKTLRAFVKASDDCAKPDDEVKLSKNAIIKAPCFQGIDDCSKYDHWPVTNTSSPFATMKIANTVNPVPPSIVISIPSKLSWNCSSLTLDLTGSYGNSGRSWRNVSITVSSNNQDADLVKLQDFLDYRYQINPPSVIPAHYFSLPNVRYTFHVQLCNFLVSCSYATASVTVIAEAVPSVKIISSQTSPMKITRSQSFSLLSSATIDSACLASSVSKNLISYNWTSFIVLNLTERSFQKNSISSSKDPSRFLLPAYSFLSNHTYEIILTVSSAFGYFQPASTSFQVVVKQGNLISKIRGGINERNIRSGESLTLDSSNSYDEDKGEGIRGTDAGLQFEWFCVQLEPSINRTSCAAVFEVPPSSFSSSVITMKALTNSENSKAQWTMTIFDESRSRSSTSLIVVSVLPLLSPTISLQSNALLGEGDGTMNAGQSLQISGIINIPAGIKSNASWSVLGSSQISLSTLSLTPLIQQFPVSPTSSQSFTMFLALPGNSLLIGSSYTFGLRCQLSYPGKPALSTITINVNSPPTPGSFSVQPKSGREIVDSFTFLCNQWIDVNLPLSYQFSYLSLSGMKIVIRSSSIVSYGSSKLPGGNSRNGTVFCFADIYDSLAANSTATFPVYVLKAEDVSTLSASTFIHTTLAVATAVDDLMKGTAIASYLLNSANCSLSSNCTSLNRFPCYSTSHTCGPCLSSSMIGQRGDSNDKCLDPLLSSSVVVDHQLKKVCAGNCSSHGRCIPYSTLTNSPTFPASSACFEGDLSCFVRCQCETGYQKSPNCEASDHQMEERSKLREILVNRVIDFINLQDASENTIYSWMNSLNEVSQVSHELSNSSISSILETAMEAITTVRDHDMDIHLALTNLLTTAETISDALIFQNNQLTLSTAGTDDDSSSLISQQQLSLFNMLSNYSLLIASSMVPNQHPNRNANGNFRMHSSLVSSSVAVGSSSTCDLNVSVTMPSTALETALGYHPSLLTIPLCSSNSTSSPLSVSLISLSSSLYHHSDFKSDPVSLYLSEQPCDDLEDKRCRVVIVMNSDNREAGLVKEAKNITVECVEGEYLNHTVRAASSSTSSGWNNYTVSCEGKAETIIVTSPAIYTSPTCNGLFGERTSDIGCTVVAYTERNITCSCPLGVFSRRRLFTSNHTEVSSTVSVSYVGMLQEIQGNFVSTVFSASSLNNETANDSWQAIVTLGSLVAGIILAMLASVYADRKMETKVGTERNIMMHAISTQSQQRRQQGRPVTFFQQKSLNVTENFSSSQQSGASSASPATVLQLAEEALPSILSSQSFWKRAWNEMKRHHRWVGVIYYFSDKFPRILRVVSLSTNIIVMLFVQSLTYNLTQGDDGSCEALHSEGSCLSPRSSYGTGGSKCFWTSDSTSISGGNCFFVQPDNSIAIVFLVAIFSALTASPIALFADWMIQNILAAPTKNEKTRGVKILASMEGREHHLEDQREDVQLMNQFISFEKDILQQENLRQRVKEEFYAMKKELIRYRKSLVKTEERVEFDGMKASTVCSFFLT
jgi:hypothetical protein